MPGEGNVKSGEAEPMAERESVVMAVWSFLGFVPLLFSI